MPDILVIGSLNADLVVRAPRFPKPGETISGEDLQIIPGGKGANQAVAAARQNANVIMAGKVGKDSFGPFLLDSLKSNKVDITNVQVDKSATGTATIIVDSHAQNSIVLSPGANGKVTSADVDALNVDATILILQLEIPLETVIHAAKWGKSKGMKVLLNPAPARELPEALIANVDYLLPNETELSLLSGIAVKDIETAEQAAKILLQRGAGHVVVTLGAKGALSVSKDKTIQADAYQVKAVDTTAAGDAFIGGFASALLRGVELSEALKYGNASGALAVTKFGAQPSLPTREEVENLINAPAAVPGGEDAARSKN
jgi:ribokinase